MDFYRQWKDYYSWTGQPTRDCSRRGGRFNRRECSL